MKKMTLTNHVIYKKNNFEKTIYYYLKSTEYEQ